jgi:hemerythrin-like domain-containing protein
MAATKRTVKKSATKAKQATRKATKSVAKRASAQKTAAKRTIAKKRASSRPSSRAGVDAIVALKNDHRTVEQLFKRFEKAGDGAHRTKRAIVDRITEELSVHASIEETVFYPAVRREVSDADSDVLEALEEHHVAKWLLSELEDLDPANERFDAKVTVLIENVRHHVKEEEEELFPTVREELGRSRLRELGAELVAAKRTAPTRPHPKAPDEPPANVIVGSAVAVMDRARTVGKRVVASR